MAGRSHRVCDPGPNHQFVAARTQLTSPSGSGLGMSRRELADLVNEYLHVHDPSDPGVDGNYIGKIEKGRVRWPGRVRRAAFRHILNVRIDADLGLTVLRGAQLPKSVRTPAQPTMVSPAFAATLPPGSLYVLRSVLDAHDLPPDGPVRAPDAMRPEVAHLVDLRLQSRYRELLSTLPWVLPDLHRSFLAHVGQRRVQAALLLAQTYRAADAVADKLGCYDLSARIITLMTAVVRESGDEIAMAVAAYVRAETFFANGDLGTGRLMLERAAERLMPDSEPRAAAAYGALHMRAAVVAARGGYLDRARDHLNEARVWASGLADGIYDGTAFGPASINIHDVALSVDGGDPDAAIRLAHRWAPPASLPAERRSHFYIDLARAHWDVKAPDDALAALMTASQIAPQHICHHAQVHTLVTNAIQSGPGPFPSAQKWLAFAEETAKARGALGPAGPSDF